MLNGKCAGIINSVDAKVLTKINFLKEWEYQGKVITNIPESNLTATDIAVLRRFSINERMQHLCSIGKLK